MKLLIITTAPIIAKDTLKSAYSPYVNELLIWQKYVNEIEFCCPVWDSEKELLVSEIPFEIEKIHKVTDFNLKSIRNILTLPFFVLKTCIVLFKAIKNSDHIHIRCPGNIGLLGCFVQILFPNKIKTAKYASNWDVNSNQPWSYRWQRWLLNNPFLTRNMQVLVYGDWANSSKNVKSFFTATYYEHEKQAVEIRNTQQKPIRFIFVGTLTKGKNPYYGINIVKSLNSSGIEATIDLYGDGILKDEIQNFVKENQLQKSVFLKGNQTKDSLKEVYKNAHFLVLQSGSFEGWPKVVAESMFWGCFPLAIPTSVVPQMLDNGTRGLLLTGNLEVDVKAILAIINDNVLYQTKAQAAMDWSRNYTLTIFEEEIQKLLETN